MTLHARAVLWFSAAILCLLTIATFWPGEMIGNTLVQLDEAKKGALTDWHPPLMAVIWRPLGLLPEWLLALNSILYWLGMGLLADELLKRRGWRWGYAMLALGLSPISLFYLGKIQRDNFMVSLFLIAVGLACKYGHRAAIVPGWIATLFRTNATFAFTPLVVPQKRKLLSLFACVLLSAALVPVNNFVNRSILGADNAQAEKSLQLFDLAGIQARSGNLGFMSDVRACYTPFWWDELELGCQLFQKSPGSQTRLWIETIWSHPVAYASHRLAHFNHTIFFLVPSEQECVFTRHDPACQSADRSLLKDALKRNALFWPVTWLLAGTILFFTRLDPISRSLVASALLFGYMHLVIGVAAGFRYFYWTELAVQIALLWQGALHGLPRYKLIFWSVGILWAAGYAYRYLLS